MGKYQLSHLEELEAESIFVLREVAAQFENPVLLFSGGKDSIVCYHLARKAFYPANVPFPLMHVDTGHNFDELYAFRDSLIEETKGRLIIASVQKSIDEGKVLEEKVVRVIHKGEIVANLPASSLADDTPIESHILMRSTPEYLKEHSCN